MGKIDFDPLYDAQDVEISAFNLVVLPNKKGSGYVAARFKNMGVDQEIIFALERTKMGWRIADIQYKDRRSLWKILKRWGTQRRNDMNNQIGTERERAVRAVEAFLEGLVKSSVDGMPLAPDVILISPLDPANPK